MDTKKISFGFSKINKKPNLLPSKVPKEEKKVELIKCVEGKAIQLVEEKPEEKPLVIPLKQQTKTSTALASLLKRRAVLLGEEELEETMTVQPDPIATNGVAVPLPESLEARAARELLAELNSTNGDEAEKPSLVLPVVHPDELPLDGAKEATLDDYDSVPIQQYGLAMLRGMGWVEPPKKKTSGAALIEEAPFVRPKGMGLGADKALKAKPLLVAPEANEVLEIKKQAFVRILGGKHKDLYGQIEGFDDHAARVIVKMAIGGAKEAFNEFLCQAVSRKEFAQYGKCINSAKYEEFKKLENEHGQIILKEDKEQKPPLIRNEASERRHGNKYHEKREPKLEQEKHRDIKREEAQYEYEHKPREESMQKYKELEQKPRIKRESTEPRHENKRSEKRESKTEEYKFKDSKYKADNYESERKYEDERKQFSASSSSASRHYEEDRYSRAHQSSSITSRSNRDVEPEQRKEKRRSRSTERRDNQKTSSSNRRHLSSSSTQSSADSESDSDDFKRKHKKKSSHKSKSKKHAKKTKSKSKRRSDDSIESDDDGGPSSRSGKSHKKKTKKSKKQRSRSRSPRGRR